MRNPDLNKIYQGDCLEVMKQWPDNFVDTIITDPPYGLSFMGKSWDHGIPGIPFWSEMLRICKPGAILLSFGGTRTFHRMTVAIENAGWQIRDCITWLYGSGFPKSHNLHDKFEGWGTALKPAWEPIIVAMKPLEGTFAQNAQEWGVAGLNVDGGRIGTEARTNPPFGVEGWRKLEGREDAYKPESTEVKGRWPANLILDEEAAAMLDWQSDNLHQAGNVNLSDIPASPMFGIGGMGKRSRFFYVAKADRTERNEGCEDLPLVECQTGCGGDMPVDDNGKERDRFKKKAQNFHPTVKPLSLMKYLCNLTKTPTGGIVLDPFCGSGTTLWAAECHNRPWIGIEQNAEYIAIAEARIVKEKAQLKMGI